MFDVGSSGVLDIVVVWLAWGVGHCCKRFS